jgi:PAS domain S-box-containing protein
VRLRATRRDIAAMPVKDVHQLVHELQVHQIELEMQNDELSRAQMELESARDRYVDLYDSSPAGHLTLDTHGTIVEANLRAGMLLGLTRNKLIGHSLANLIAPRDADTFHRHGREVLKTGTRQTCEVQLRTKAGASCWVSLESQTVHEEPGRSTHWRTALQDISNRKRVEQELVSRQAQIEGVIASAMDAIITVDEGERMVVFNRAAESMFLCPAADAIGQPLDRFIPKRFRQAHHGYVSRFARTHATSRSMGSPGTLFGLRANGEEFPLEASISHVQVDGKTLLTVILRDVTERMIAEGALKASETFTRTVLDSIPSQVCVLDKNGVLLKTNDAWKEFAGRDSNRVVPHSDIGQNYLEACRRASAGGDSTAQMILGGIDGVLGGRQPRFSAEYACHLPEEERWYLMRVASLKESQGVVVSHTDISERVRMTRLVEHHVLLLNDKREELESLTGKLLAAQEEERKRIARDLHDDFNQRLAALAVELESMERAPIAPPEPLVRQLAAIRIQVGQLSDNLHDDFNQRLAALAVELENMERTFFVSPELVARQLAAIRVQVG